MFRYLFVPKLEKIKCKICGKTSPLISRALEVCLDCIRNKPEKAVQYIKNAHKKSREKFSLPTAPPKNKDGVSCNLCVNKCKIGKMQVGYCGLRTNVDGNLKFLGGKPANGILEWYYDSLPTNCVADGFCAGGSSAGYPKYSYSKNIEYGYKNLAVFYGACTFNCLFCQNWRYRYLAVNLNKKVSSNELANKVDEKTSCICYFGGDPAPQLPHAIKTSKIALENSERILRICFESNGSMNKNLLKKSANISIESGGCIKFDLKAMDENLNIAICGVTNKQTLENFKYLAEFGKKREEPPFLIASTLLIPGYIDALEVEKIAKFIAELDPLIPYSLLAFYPQFYMSDLPITSKKLAMECLKVAKDCGLERVRIGNLHLLR